MESPSRYQYEHEDITNSSNGSFNTNGDDIWSTNMRGTPLSNISSGSNGVIGDSVSGATLESGGGLDIVNGTGSNLSTVGSNNISIKVIEALRGQVDTLSSTNLQLTRQYQDVLKKLQEATDREASLSAEVSKLQLGNLELKNNLEDSSNEAKQCDQLYEEMKNEYNTLQEENADLDSLYRVNVETVKALNSRYDRTKAKKNALLSLQEDYKQVCDDEVEAVRNRLDTLDTKVENFQLNEKSYLDELEAELERTTEVIEHESLLLDEQLGEQEKSWNDLLNSMDLETISSHYQESKAQLLELAQKLEMPVVLDEDNYISTDSTSSFTKPVAKFRKPTPDSALKRSSFYGVTSPLVTQGFKRQDPHASSRTSSNDLPGIKKK